MSEVRCPRCNGIGKVEKMRGQHRGEFCAGCGTHIRWLSQEVTLDRALDFVMPFGKEKGKTMRDLDKGYLDWLSKNIEKGNIAEMAKLVYESR